MENAIENITNIRKVVVDYLSPNSVRKIVRKPRVEIDAIAMTIPFKNGTLALQRWGQGEIILLIHGWAANQTDMFGFVPEVLAQGFCAVTMDLPAHGESSGDIVGLEELGLAVSAAGEHLGHLKGVIAHSVGGAALQLALSNSLDVEKVVLLASPEDYLAGAHQLAMSHGFSGDDKKRMFEIFDDLGIVVQIRSSEFVPQISTPALIIHSKDDPVVPFSTGQNLSRYWKASRLFEVDGLKHRGVLKDPGIINEAVTFLTK